MNKETDILSRIGRKMPYTLPENSLDYIENEVLSRIGPPVRRKRFLPAILGFTAIAASVLIFALGRGDRGLSDLEEAFADLSIQDQDYITDIYSNDTFINYYEDQNY